MVFNVEAFEDTFAVLDILTPPCAGCSIVSQRPRRGQMGRMAHSVLDSGGC